MSGALGPYGRDRQVDKPGIAGARWWHDALVDQAAQIARRDAIRNILVAGGVIAGFGAMLAMCVKSGHSSSSSTPTGAAGELPSDYTSKRQTSLDMQRQYGWAFGAVGEALVFDGVAEKPFEPGALASLVTDLSPVMDASRRYAISTLFMSPDAQPTLLSQLDADEQAGFQKLGPLVKPIHTPAMDAAYAKGKAVAGLFAPFRAVQGATAPKAMLVVDLAGPLAVAFAAGAADVFEPIFLFDNWPHPRGVVRAHETLAAAAYYQPRFADTRQRAGTTARPAMFVLDRNRLTPYTDDATQFDNRWIAKLPLTAAEITALGASHVLLVCPENTTAPFELDDMNDELVTYVAGGTDVKALSLELLAVDAGDAGPIGEPTYFYGGSASSHHAFFLDYPWAKPALPAKARPASNAGKSYVPTARSSPYSFGPPNASSSPSSPPSLRQHAVPTAFGTVPVVVAVGTGLVLGARYSRSGSWNRLSSSSSSSGG